MAENLPLLMPNIIIIVIRVQGSGFSEHSSYWGGNVGKLESIKATDKYTLVFKMKQVDPLFLGAAVLQLEFYVRPRGDQGTWRCEGLEKPGRYRSL